MLLQTHKYTYLLVILLGALFVLFSNPFLRYPYDVFAHLIAIDELYHGATTTTTSIQQGRLLWHDIWATLFHIFQIDSQQFFLRAKVIYSVQVTFSLFAIYYFSHVMLRNLFKNISSLTLIYLSLWSTLIWLSIFATHSVYYHLIWTLWYSINYQVTLPLFFYMSGLTLVIFMENISLKKKVFFVLQIILISLFILKIHSMEFLYYMMYIAAFSLFYIDKLYYAFKKHYLVFIGSIVSFIYFMKNYQVETPKIFNYMDIEKLPLLYSTIISLGDKVTSHFNRSSTIINEFMYLIFYIGLIFFIFFIWRFYQEKPKINIRLLFVILITSLFILIPQYQFSAGLFSLITKSNSVHRIYFSSSLFILLPIFFYYIAQTFTLKLRYINMLFILTFLSVFIFSKQSSVLSHNYYKNIQSIYASFNKNKFNFHLSQKEVDTIEKKIHIYEKNNHSGKENYYYARSDIAFVIKYLYHKKVYWEGRRANPDYRKHYKEDLALDTYHKVLFETPKMFPKYIPYW